MSKSTKIKAHLALLAVALIYGLNYSVAKDVMPNFVQPRAFILMRATGAVILFFALGLSFKKEHIQSKHWLRIIAAGFFGVAANQLLFFEGLNITTPISASVIMTTNPIMVLSLSAVFLKVPLTWPRIFGISLGISGALYLISQGGSLQSVFNEGESLGNLLVMLNALSYAAYLVVVKPLMAIYRPFTVIKWVFLAGFLIVIPFGAPQVPNIDWMAMPAKIYWEIGFVIICTTFLAYLLNIYALKTVSSTTVSFYIYLQPLVATGAAIMLGTDEPNRHLLFAALLIFLGVYLVSFYRRSKAQ
ncbi:MAG: DMT family transporter [Bacteroidetes bacterium]|nr:DMT family transporter [Bacteroidota bacterium]